MNMQPLHIVSEIIGIVSIAILIFGSVQVLFYFLKNELNRVHKTYSADNLFRMRAQLGQYLLLGLELLIASDIIETIVNPGLNEIAQVGGVVIIRTLLSYFLNKEIAAEKEKR